MPCVCVCMHAPCFVFKSASAGLAPRQTRGLPLAKAPAKEYEKGQKLNNEKPPFSGCSSKRGDVGRSWNYLNFPRIPPWLP